MFLFRDQKLRNCATIILPQKISHFDLQKTFFSEAITDKPVEPFAINSLPSMTELISGNNDLSRENRAMKQELEKANKHNEFMVCL